MTRHITRRILPALLLASAACAPIATAQPPTLSGTVAPAFVSGTCNGGDTPVPADISRADGTAVENLGLIACHSPSSGMVQLQAFDVRGGGGGLINNEDLTSTGVTTADELRLTVTLPAGTTKHATVIGGAVRDITYDAATRELTVWASPRILSYALFTPCLITSCDVERADITWDAALNGAVMTDVAPGNPAAAQMVAPISGSWVATTAQMFGLGVRPVAGDGSACTPGTPGCALSFAIDLAGPHLRADGVTLNRAEITAFLPDAMLEGSMGVPAGMSPEQFTMLRREAGAALGSALEGASCQKATKDRSTGLLCGSTTHFSAPTIMIRPPARAAAVTPPLTTPPSTTPPSSTAPVTTAPSLRAGRVRATSTRTRAVTVSWQAASAGQRYRVTLTPKKGKRYTKTTTGSTVRFARVAKGTYAVTVTPVTSTVPVAAQAATARVRVR